MSIPVPFFCSLIPFPLHYFGRAVQFGDVAIWRPLTSCRITQTVPEVLYCVYHLIPSPFTFSFVVVVVVVVVVDVDVHR